MAEEPSRVEKRTFGALFAIAAALFLYTVSPLWVPVFLGILLAVVAGPLKRRLGKRWARHPRVVAAAITTVTLALGIGLVVAVAFGVVRELVQFFGSSDQGISRAAMHLLQRRQVARLLAAVGESPEHVV